MPLYLGLAHCALCVGERYCAVEKDTHGNIQDQEEDPGSKIAPLVGKDTV